MAAKTGRKNQHLQGSNLGLRTGRKNQHLQGSNLGLIVGVKQAWGLTLGHNPHIHHLFINWVPY